MTSTAGAVSAGVGFTIISATRLSLGFFARSARTAVGCVVAKAIRAMTAMRMIDPVLSCNIITSN
jgi:hypothetical protein